MHTVMSWLSDPHMHIGITVCKWGSPYAYGDCYKIRDITVCICQFQFSYGDKPHVLSLYAYGDCRMHTGILSMLICILGLGYHQHLHSPNAYGDLPGPHMHMGKKARENYRSIMISHV